MTEAITRLLDVFPGSFINAESEIILSRRHNIYFQSEGIVNEDDVTAKLLIWCSRDFVYGRLSLDRLREYSDLDFSKEDLGLIYSKIGNGINPKLAQKFKASEFTLEVLND